MEESNPMKGCVISLSGGGIIAGITSYLVGNSWVWIIIHMFFGWLYVLYALLFKGFKIHLWFDFLKTLW